MLASWLPRCFLIEQLCKPHIQQRTKAKQRWRMPRSRSLLIQSLPQTAQEKPQRHSQKLSSYWPTSTRPSQIEPWKRLWRQKAITSRPLVDLAIVVEGYVPRLIWRIRLDWSILLHFLFCHWCAPHSVIWRCDHTKRNITSRLLRTHVGGKDKGYKMFRSSQIEMEQKRILLPFSHNLLIGFPHNSKWRQLPQKQRLLSRSRPSQSRLLTGNRWSSKAFSINSNPSMSHQWLAKNFPKWT